MQNISIITLYASEPVYLTSVICYGIVFLLFRFFRFSSVNNYIKNRAEKYLTTLDTKIQNRNKKYIWVIDIDNGLNSLLIYIFENNKQHLVTKMFDHIC